MSRFTSFACAAAVLLVVVMGGVHADVVASAPSTLMEATGESLLSDLRLDGLLGTECEDDCHYCDDERHVCVLDAGFRNAECQHEEQCTPLGSCKDHACDPNQEQDQEQNQEPDQIAGTIERAATLLSEASLGEIRSFLDINGEAVVLNTERRSLQLLGCGGTVVANVPFDHDRFEALLEH